MEIGRITNNYTLGYLLDSPKILLSILADYKAGSKPMYTGFLSLVKYDRFVASYDPNTKTFSSSNLFAFGNRELSSYVMVGVLREQYILTRRSVVDSDNTVGFPAASFVNPKNKYADVLRVSFSFDLGMKGFTGAFIDNAFMIRTSGTSGYLFVQNLTENASPIRPSVYSTYYGAGFGYRFGRLADLTPILSFQSKGITINLSASF